MREIKFRAWHIEKKMMFSVRDWHWDNHDGWEIELSCLSEYFGSAQVIPMQFTGLKDKNGKEIYEGDIVKRYYEDDDFEIGKILFDESSAGFVWKCEKFPVGINTEHSEVIGNIYENPELLGG